MTPRRLTQRSVGLALTIAAAALIALAAPSRLQLQWINAAHYDGIVVYASTSSNRAAAWQPLARLPGAATSWALPSGAAGLWFTVTATNRSSDPVLAPTGGLESDYAWPPVLCPSPLPPTNILIRTGSQ